MAIKYELPQNWIIYDKLAIVDQLIEAKAALLSLKTIPYQKRWAEELQIVQLKREIAGTSRIEGADFTEGELDAALKESIEQLTTRSQRQAAATVKAYRWIAKLENDQPITEELICNIHKLIIVDADDDHCPPGELRNRDQNVIFGMPRHRGCEGGSQCVKAFTLLIQAINQDFLGHDPLIQALATHYHFAAMHPFLDGNGRSARALEALMLQKIGLKHSLFIAMSNYYYEEKNDYLNTLALVRASKHNLTPFLLFGLRGIKLQCQRLFDEIKKNISKALFRNNMYDLFIRLQSTRKRVIAERQIEILKLLLDENYTLDKLYNKVTVIYKSLSNSYKAFIRDINYLIGLGAIDFTKEDNVYNIFVRLEWATEITESEFFEKNKKLPKSKTHNFLSLR
ncbi:MAG: Fic family protein [Deltaproteobacteria bacterium]|nr:Fic family protein [Deltaproteobacteria bacterium]